MQLTAVLQQSSFFFFFFFKPAVTQGPDAIRLLQSERSGLGCVAANPFLAAFMVFVVRGYPVRTDI